MQFVSLKDAVDLFPRRPHLATVYRWAVDGVNRPKVRLKTVRQGNRLLTSAEWIEQFLRECSERPEDRRRRIANAAADAALQL